ncbi:glycine--tRNA ligase, partial [Candidatus Dojkabacteria bacterium]|nr:glycine--tRNA ligase [Candidatus Dojkabacteria bacterium]
PYGTALKENLRKLWWDFFIDSRDNIFGIDSSIILKSEIWEASGHTSSFSDALIDCKNCKNRTRADHLIEDNVKDIKVEGLSMDELEKIIIDNKIKCPKCGSTELTKPRSFNLLFETHIGILEESKSLAYLRGEIAQGIFLNYKNILDTMRTKVPFGIGQYGKAFRNEITMGQFVHRSLEFDLMEFEYFIKESDWEETYKYWQDEMISFTKLIGLNQENLRWREHEDFERSFYSTKTMDIEYEYPFGFKEMFGLAYRTDYDLKNHMEKSGKDLTYRDPITNEKFIPHVIEPTFGLSRLTGVTMFDAYHEEEINGKTRTILKFDPKIAPIKAAVFALQKDEKLIKKSEELYNNIKGKFAVEHDVSSNIGKLYRRQDEIGTPWCITIDYQTLEDNSVTIRDRDSLKQERLQIEEVIEKIEKSLA